MGSFSGDFYDTLGTLPLANPYGHCVSEGLDIADVLWYNGWLACCLFGRKTLRKTPVKGRFTTMADTHTAPAFTLHHYDITPTTKANKNNDIP